MDKFTEAYKKVLQKYKTKNLINEEGGACCGAAPCGGAPAGGPAPCAGGPANVSAAANPPNQTPPMPTVPPHPKPTYKAGIHTRNVGPGAYVPFVVPGALWSRKKKKRRVKRRKKR